MESDFLLFEVCGFWWGFLNERRTCGSNMTCVLRPVKRLQERRSGYRRVSPFQELCGASLGRKNRSLRRARSLGDLLK